MMLRVMDVQKGLSALRAEEEKVLGMGRAMTDLSGFKLADVCQQVVISSFGQLVWFQLYYQLHHDFF